MRRFLRMAGGLGFKGIGEMFGLGGLSCCESLMIFDSLL